jgi:hypothetical protein
MTSLSRIDRVLALKIIEQAPELEITEDWVVMSGHYSEDAILLAYSLGHLVQVFLPECDTFEEAAEKARQMLLRGYELEDGDRNLLYLNAISVLEKGWRYGRELRLWHARVYGP